MTVTLAEPTLPNLNLNVPVETPDMVSALDAARPELVKIIAAIQPALQAG